MARALRRKGQKNARRLHWHVLDRAFS